MPENRPFGAALSCSGGVVNSSSRRGHFKKMKEELAALTKRISDYEQGSATVSTQFPIG
jgi:hypothetical protein